ncbi:hypothetical protein GCM10007162_12070 [Ignatzschineria ureiclastica]|uniref:hypothetical protein n=1 Tax=Ignatzschineria ureiclastica TaxID=472582 RepID=UPI00167A5040|nr:hypothetical protein [Ignatzschineria ureiclastica]GGZ97486.1 hypothetical protein GCM10007162_12070 [Ignatzschineria ureiclastica]
MKGIGVALFIVGIVGLLLCAVMLKDIDVVAAAAVASVIGILSGIGFFQLSGHLDKK